MQQRKLGKAASWTSSAVWMPVWDPIPIECSRVLILEIRRVIRVIIRRVINLIRLLWDGRRGHVDPHLHSDSAVARRTADEEQLAGHPDLDRNGTGVVSSDRRPSVA
ncbi:hypothetical protein FNV43_RR03287 [Rhamnella rubrinervis]|uniref:Uncharacterized protein n=1 Tax=Rhamnella rubrinervis TaxID=2594499 RepID=A0A8K0MNX6_9ROSA|nr:hypothetical protein FNV43_RR03287 [Rhamnella rubrinervis]